MAVVIALAATLVGAGGASAAEKESGKDGSPIRVTRHVDLRVT